MNDLIGKVPAAEELDPMTEALRKRDAERQEKIDSGEIVCDYQDPDNCESCSG